MSVKKLFISTLVFVFLDSLSFAGMLQGAVNMSNASPLVITDLFGASTQQNFLTGGDGAKSYGWYAKNTVNATVMNANTTNAGYATITCTNNSGIGATSVTVPMIYKIISGDFDIETGYLDNADQAAEGVGIGVFSTSNINIHVYLIKYIGSPSVAARDSDGATESIVGTDATSSPQFFRVTRVGDVFTFYRKVSSGDSWTEHGSVTHALGSSVWVGLFAMTNNTSNNLTVKFDNFTKN